MMTCRRGTAAAALDLQPSRLPGSAKTLKSWGQQPMETCSGPSGRSAATPHGTRSTSHLQRISHPAPQFVTLLKGQDGQTEREGRPAGIRWVINTVLLPIRILRLDNQTWVAEISPNHSSLPSIPSGVARGSGREPNDPQLQYSLLEQPSSPSIRDLTSATTTTTTTTASRRLWEPHATAPTLLNISSLHGHTHTVLRPLAACLGTRAFCSALTSAAPTRRPRNRRRLRQQRRTRPHLA